VREIALLGGSFNPPHVGHLMAAWYVLATEPVSEVWLLPSYSHPFGKTLVRFEERVELCRLAAATIRGLHVCTAELELAADPLVGKTARTLEHLRAKHPDLRFALVIGTDILAETDKWYRWDRVQELARVVAGSRTGEGAGRQGAPGGCPPKATRVRSP